MDRRNDMERLNTSLTGKKDRPIKVVQFGEGNFLRAFVDYMIDIANEQGLFDGDIVLIILSLIFHQNLYLKNF